MATKEEQAEVLFGKLDTQIRNRQTKRALKTADEVLRLLPGDPDAVGCKVALLIELGSAGDALALIDATPGLAGPLAFERAYCAYRLGRLQEALAALAGAGPGRAAPALELEAQLRYRLGEHDAAAALYRRLLDAHPAQAAGAAANAVAALVAGGRAGEVGGALGALRVASAAGLEVSFNVACGLLAEGRLEEAERQLAVARRVGEEALYEEELEEEEVAAELAPVAAQAAFVAGALGRWEEAVAGLQRVLELAGRGGGDAAAATAAGDLCAALLRARPGDRRAAAEGVRRVEPFLERAGGAVRLKPELESRLGAAHSEAVLAAYGAAALAANKADVAREAVRGLERRAPRPAGLPLLQAALLARDGKVKEAGEVLAAAAAAAPRGAPAAAAAVDAQLLRAQLAAAGGDPARAAALLGDLPAEVSSRPGVVATRVALLEAGGDLGGAAAAMAAALGGGGGGGAAAAEPAAARWVQRRLAAVELARGDLEAAAGHLGALVEADEAALEDPELLALLPRLLALARPADAAPLLARLPAPPALAAAEVDALETAGVSAAGSQRRAQDAAAKAPAAAEAPAAAGAAAAAAAAPASRAGSKRKRRKRLPKGFDPDNPGPPPDPERWLPKWQRAEAKRAKKKRRDKTSSEALKGSQGAGVVDASLDKSGAAEAAAPAAAPAKPQAGGKKKGKGRR